MEVPEVGFAGVVLATNLLTELIKKVDTLGRLHAYIPIIVEVIGFSLGMAVGLGWFEALFVGLSAMGLYSGIKTTNNRLF